MKEVVLKLRRKGVLILPKEIRTALGVEEGDSLIAELEGNSLILKPFKIKRVRVKRELVEKLLREELELEERKYEQIGR